MFKRLKYSALVLRASTAEPDPRAQIKTELDEFRGRFATDWFGEPAPNRKVGMVLLELMFTGIVSVMIIAPILSRALNLMTERAHIVLGTATGMLVFYSVDKAVDRLENVVSLKGKLDFLSPYFGNRISHVIRTLKN